MKLIHGSLLAGTVLSTTGCMQAMVNYQMDQVNQQIIMESGASVGQHANLSDPKYVQLAQIFDEYHNVYVTRNLDFYNLTGWQLCDDTRETYNSYAEFQEAIQKRLAASEVKNTEKKEESGSLLAQMESDDTSNAAEGLDYTKYLSDDHTLTYAPAGDDCDSPSTRVVKKTSSLATTMEIDLGNGTKTESSSKVDNQSTMVMDLADDYSISLTKTIMDVEYMNDPKWEYMVMSTGSPNGDSNKAYSTYLISESQDMPGIIDTVETTYFPDGRIKHVIYKGNRIQSITRIKDFKRHGLQEYRTKSLASIMGAETCYDQGVKVISESCETF
ncbi:hypothetical protein A3715_18450 [Oleiphilus sp. HI0009]|nr:MULTISPECIES: hypothetical protein [unclassified Oleiphilus]KZX82959.1 hypothetical protein A3715_18450 [Oleiphilus sp. HI0009]KZY63956.1 hypothetical protein A3738_11440 [Oleiphilus sp. HI0066]KZY74050.1 hypothetical protein A3739_14920 [Oleiphilus sp. HI0067]MCH2158033.1 hypothetical protein [Oleiphilaceae bacterium]